VPADLPADFMCNAFKQPIANVVAKGVIDVLELIQIKEDQGHARLAALGFASHALQFLLEAMSVVQAGQGVALGQIDHAFGQQVGLSHIFVNPHPPVGLTFLIQYAIAMLGDDAAVVHDDFAVIAAVFGMQQFFEVAGHQFVDRGAVFCLL